MKTCRSVRIGLIFAQSWKMRSSVYSLEFGRRMAWICERTRALLLRIARAIAETDRFTLEEFGLIMQRLEQMAGEVCLELTGNEEAAEMALESFHHGRHGLCDNLEFLQELNGVELLVEGVSISGIVSREEAESIRAKFAEQGYRVEIRT